MYFCVGQGFLLLRWLGDVNRKLTTAVKWFRCPFAGLVGKQSLRSIKTFVQSLGLVTNILNLNLLFIFSHMVCSSEV